MGGGTGVAVAFMVDVGVASTAASLPQALKSKIMPRQLTPTTLDKILVTIYPFRLIRQSKGSHLMAG